MVIKVKKEQFNRTKLQKDNLKIQENNNKEKE
jgi:hypothetical protein